MPAFYVNSFERLYPQFTDGLNYVIANYPGSGSPDINNLNNVVIGYIQTLQDPDTIPPATLNPLVADLVASILYNSVNEYVNNQVGQNLTINSAQMALIDSIHDGILNNSIESLDDYFDSVDELISSCDSISSIDKSQIYMASIIARSSYDYWIGVVGTPGGWSTYINSNAAINYANVPKWVALSFTSALSGFSQGQKASAAIGGNGVFNDAGRFLGSPLSLLAAIGVTAGKVIFQWSQRPITNGSIGANISGVGCNCGK